MAHDKDVTSEIVERMVAMAKPYYNQPHRHYHTLKHINQMFDDARELGWLWDMDIAELIAIAFHDGIWVPGDDENSVKLSALLVKSLYHQGQFDWLREFYERIRLLDEINDAVSIISDTYKHLPHGDANSKKVIDLDMFGFSRYDRQAKISRQLKREYAGMATPEGRETFLISMLQRKPFYYKLPEPSSSEAYTIILDELKSIKGVSNDE